jgi:peptidyl-prolyl cis-trans isomerase C
MALAATFNGCSPKQTSDVLARVGDRVITTDDFKNEVQWRLGHHHPLPERTVLLDEMVARELALQKAKALGLQNDADVQRGYDDMLVGELKDHELLPQVESAKVSSEEIQAAYQRDIAKYTKPAKTRLAMIYMKFDRVMNAEQKAAVAAKMAEAAKAASALTDLSRGFGAVAMNFSEDQASRYRGGDVGWFDATAPVFRFPKEVVRAGLELKQIGQITPVIDSANGLYLLMKTDSREQAVTPLATVRASIQRRLLAAKKQQIEDSFAKNLRASTPVQTDATLLSRVEYPTTTVAQVDEKMPPAMPRSQ